MAAHRHAFHELIVPVRGWMILQCREGRFRVGAGDVLVYPAGMVHAEEADPADPIESFFLPFRDSGIRETVLLRRHDHGSRMRQLIRWLHADQSARAPQAVAERDALFRALLARFLRDDLEQEPPLARQIRAFVRDRLGECLTLDRLAAEAGLSRSYFVRTYRRLTGESPMMEVRRLRLERARDLVMTTRLPLKHIAETVGIGSPYAFSRLFRRFFGLPPGALRRQFDEPG